jgi:response regulator RpfG family c-di-GMP phosphodiesterase
MKSKAINAILIDDRIEQLQDFIQLARTHGILFKTFNNVEEGMEYLNQNRSKTDAIVLDAISFSVKDQERGTEKQIALRTAINHLNKMKFEDGFVVPYCVYTGHFDKIADSIEGEISVFVKGRDQEKLFKFLHEQVNSHPIFQLKQKHLEVVYFAEKYLADSDIAMVLDVLGFKISKGNSENTAFLGNLRFLEEVIFDKVCYQLLSKQPESFAKRNSNLGRTKQIIKELKEAGKIPNYLLAFSRNIYDVASAFGSHKPKADSRKPTIYTLQALRACLLDLILWAMDVMDSFEKGPID